jgi:hypothetical protein
LVRPSAEASPWGSAGAPGRPFGDPGEPPVAAFAACAFFAALAASAFALACSDAVAVVLFFTVAAAPGDRVEEANPPGPPAAGAMAALGPDERCTA